MLIRVPRMPTVPDWPAPEGMPALLHRLLRLRGVGSPEEARAFLRPGTDALRDPFLLSGMREAVAEIESALANKQKICVYGDYDVDGVCASAILCSYLKSRGADCAPYLPSRHSEGYGLNEGAIEKIAAECALLITVDCGITAVGLVARAKALGLRAVITDHHRPEGDLPDCPVINPLLGGYPFGYLCGAGVAFQLVSALGGRAAAMEYIDFAALATIADIVPLTDENRALASLGLKKINASPRPGIRALIDAAGLSGRELSAGNVAFQLTPRLNASGRIGDAMRAYKLLTGTNLANMRALADELNEENARRKDLEQKALDEAEAKLKDFDFTAHRAIIVEGEGWNPGVIGLAASRLTEKYNYPAIVLTTQGDTCTGSCRSIEGVDIHDALSHASAHLIRFGGHRMAAGLTLKKDELAAFASDLDAYLFAAVPADAYIPRVEYDCDVVPEELTPEVVRALDALSPTGCQNPAPLFRMRAQIASARAVGVNGAHLKLSLRARGGALDGIWFRKGELARELAPEGDALFAAGVNCYQGRESVQAEMRAFAPVGGEALLAQADARGEALFRAFLTDGVYNKRHHGGETAPVSPEEMARGFLERPQGALIVTADAEGAREILRLPGIGPEVCDISLGAYPRDARCFRAIAIAPCGACPAGYGRVYLYGVPDGLLPATHRADSVPLSRWFTRAPQVDQLRRVYASARAAAKTPRPYRDLDAIIQNVALQADMGEAMAAAGLLILMDMRLVHVLAGSDGARLSLPSIKANPEDNPLYARMCAWRRAAKGGGSA